MTRLCLHCKVELGAERPWPGLGFMADCPECKSTFLRRVQPAEVREEVVIAAQAKAIVDGRLGSPERWIRAWCVVSDAYLSESKIALAAGDEETASARLDDAARCLDDGLTLWRWTPASHEAVLS